MPRDGICADCRGGPWIRRELKHLRSVVQIDSTRTTDRLDTRGAGKEAKGYTDDSEHSPCQALLKPIVGIEGKRG